jgi:hypothetical protein
MRARRATYSRLLCVEPDNRKICLGARSSRISGLRESVGRRISPTAGAAYRAVEARALARGGVETDRRNGALRVVLP